MTHARVLVLDIETSPNLAWAWGLWQQNIALNQLERTGDVLSFAARWHGEKAVQFHSVYDFDAEEITALSRVEMVGQAWQLLNEADAVVTWNGISFDIPHLHRIILETGMSPPSPFRQIDLCQTVKRRFRFTSNKLDHVARQLGVGAKVGHTGFQLWRDCMEGDARAWRLMRKYNVGDVKVTDALYGKLLPWVPSHPHVGLYTTDPSVGQLCGRCGSDKLQRRGYAVTALGRFARFQCQGCGSWSRSGKRVDGVDARPIA